MTPPKKNSPPLGTLKCAYYRLSQSQAHNSARLAAGAKRGSWEQEFDGRSSLLHRFLAAAPHHGPLRALRRSTNGTTISFRYVVITTRLVQPRGSNMALGSRSLIGVVGVCVDCPLLPLITDLCGLSAPQAMARLWVFAV